MPKDPDWLRERGSELESPQGRFNCRPAIAIIVGEEVWNTEAKSTPNEALRQVEADWLLDDEPGLGRADTLDGTAGRGAEGWVAVVQWLGEAIPSSIVDIGVGYALAGLVSRLRKWRKGREEHGEHGGFAISRGAAAYLAATHVADAFNETGPLEIEAVEEPSSIAGHEITEIAYVSVEPWVVLLRNRVDKVRYLVVVTPSGTVEGALCLEF